jgi:hypothetical protein
MKNIFHFSGAVVFNIKLGKRLVKVNLAERPLIVEKLNDNLSIASPARTDSALMKSFFSGYCSFRAAGWTSEGKPGDLPSPN